MRDIEAIIWNPVIDFLAEELLNEVRDNGSVVFSRFLTLSEPTNMRKTPKARIMGVLHDVEDFDGCVAVLMNKTRTFSIAIKDKTTPAFRHAIDKHFLDRNNRELAGRFRSSDRHKAFLKSRILEFVTDEVNPKEKDLAPPPRRRL